MFRIRVLLSCIRLLSFLLFFSLAASHLIDKRLKSRSTRVSHAYFPVLSRNAILVNNSHKLFLSLRLLIYFDPREYLFGFRVKEVSRKEAVSLWGSMCISSQKLMKCCTDLCSTRIFSPGIHWDHLIWFRATEWQRERKESWQMRSDDVWSTREEGDTV